MESTPASLLEKLRQPAPGPAWDRFVFLYTPLLSLWAVRLGVTGPDADDLLQDVYATLVQELPKFHYDPDKRFRAWLWTILVNKVRERRRRRTLPTRSLDGDEFPELAIEDTADEAAEREYRDILVRRALELIRTESPPASWAAFWECITTDHPAAAIAARAGLSAGAVYQIKSRILRQLRQELRGLLD